MRRRCKQSGMSLMELLVALATILILISALIGVGSGIKTRAQVDQTRGMLETLVTALEQYYSDFGDFPMQVNSKGDMEIALYGDPPTDTVAVQGVLPTKEVWSSAALFYFLDKNPPSRAIVEGIASTLLSSIDNNRNDIAIEIPTGSTPIDFPRYIDPWGTSINYEYLTGTAFPILTSAGPDTEFETPDDITSK